MIQQFWYCYECVSCSSCFDVRIDGRSPNEMGPVSNCPVCKVDLSLLNFRGVLPADEGGYLPCRGCVAREALEAEKKPSSVDDILWSGAPILIEEPGVEAMAERLKRELTPDRYPLIQVVAIRDEREGLPWLVLESGFHSSQLVDFQDEDGRNPMRLWVRVGLATRDLLERLPEWEP